MLNLVRIIFYLQQFFEWITKPQTKKKVIRPTYREPPTAPDKYKRMLIYHNEFRHEYGLKPVEFNTKLCVSALIHAERIAEDNAVSHKDFDKRVTLGVTGEVIIHYKDNPLATFQKIIQNKNRRSTILSDVEYVGFGEDNGYWVLLFAKEVS